MSHFFTPDDYAIAVAESPVAKYVYTPYVKSVLMMHPVNSVLDLRCSEGFFHALPWWQGLSMWWVLINARPCWTVPFN